MIFVLEVAHNQPMPSLRHDDVLEEDISVILVIISRQNYRLSIVEYVIFTVEEVHPLENICSNMRKVITKCFFILLFNAGSNLLKRKDSRHRFNYLFSESSHQR